MGFGNGAFQAARIAIDGVTLIENIVDGKIQSATPIILPASTLEQTNTGKAWGNIIVNQASNSLISNAGMTASWLSANQYGSIIDAIKLPTGTDSFDLVSSNYANHSASVTNTVTTGTTPGQQYMLTVLLSTSFTSAQSGPLSISDTGGLTWIQRTVVNGQGNTGANSWAVWEFYAVGTTPLIGDTVTVSISGAEDFFMCTLLSKSTNTSTPFSYDTNASLPGTNSSTSNVSTGYTAGITTSQKPDLVFAFFGGIGSSTQVAGSVYPNSQSIFSTLQTFTANPPIKITSGASNGYVLTSDTVGHATWQIAGAGSGYWTQSGGNITNNNAGGVYTTGGNVLDDGSGNMTLDNNLTVGLTPPGTAVASIESSGTVGAYLIASNSYGYDITAINAAGVESSASYVWGGVEGVTPHPIDLSWSSSPDAVSYNIYRINFTTPHGPGLIANVVTTSHTDDGNVDYGAAPASPTVICDSPIQLIGTTEYGTNIFSINSDSVRGNVSIVANDNNTGFTNDEVFITTNNNENSGAFIQSWDGTRTTYRFVNSAPGDQVFLSNGMIIGDGNANPAQVVTGNNTLDDGSGNTTITGICSAGEYEGINGGSFTVYTTRLIVTQAGAMLSSYNTLDDGSGNLEAAGTVRVQGASHILSGSGVPSTTGSTVGDFYIRTDGAGAALSNLYVCTVSGSPDTWVGIA